MAHPATVQTSPAPAIRRKAPQRAIAPAKCPLCRDDGKPTEYVNIRGKMVPISKNIPNARTRAALEDNTPGKRYKSFAEMVADD